MSVPERVLLLCGSIFLSVLVSVLLVLPGLSVLTSLPNRTVDRTGLIGVTSEGNATAVWAWIFARELPTLQDSESVIVTFIAEVASSTASSEPSFLLTGEIAEGLITCTGAGVVTTSNLTYDSLTFTEKEMLTTQLVYSRSFGYINNSTSEEVVSFDTAALALEKQNFVRLVPDPTFFEEKINRTADVSDGKQRVYDSRYATFTCSFSAATFWEQTGGTRVFTFPEVVGAVSTSSSEKLLYLQRDLSFVPDTGTVFRSSDLEPDSLTSEKVDFDSWARWWDKPKMVVVVRGPTAVFEESEASQVEERELFVAGAGIAALGALGIATSKTIAELSMVGWLRHRATVSVWRSKLASWLRKMWGTGE